MEYLKYSLQALAKTSKVVVVERIFGRSPLDPHAVE